MLYKILPVITFNQHNNDTVYDNLCITFLNYSVNTGYKLFFNITKCWRYITWWYTAYITIF